MLTVVWRRNPLDLWRTLSAGPKAVVAVVTVTGGLWAVLSGGELVPVGRAPSEFTLAEEVIARTGRHVREAVGVVGWLDTQIPESMFALWCFAAGMIMMFALVAEPVRRAVGAALALGLFVVTGWVLEIAQGDSAGLFWQGRYALPMLIGFVIVAGLAVDTGRSVGEVAAIVPGILALVVWNLSFLQELRRWGVGEHGSIRPWAWDTWGSPLPVLSLAAVHAAGSAGIGWLLWSRPPNHRTPHAD